MAEWLGLIISLLAIAYMIFRWGQEVRRHAPQPGSLEAREQAEKLHQYLKKLNIDIDKPYNLISSSRENIEEDEDEEEKDRLRASIMHESSRIPVAPMPQKPHLSDHQVLNLLESKAHKELFHGYGAKSLASRSRVEEMMRRLPTKKEMVVFHEIIGRPRGIEP